MDEKGHDAHLTDLGREKIAPNQPDLFIVPDLSQLIHEIDTDASLSEQEKSAKRLELERDYAEKSETIHNISQLIKAYALYEKDVEYVVQDGKVLIVDQFTGRLMPGRRYSEGMHQAIEAKEGVQIEGETQTLATITIQNYYRMYDKLAGMTGTAETEEGEFWQIYEMDVVVIPTNRPIRREDSDDMVYKTRREKYNAIIDEIERQHQRGRPVPKAAKPAPQRPQRQASSTRGGDRGARGSARGHHDRDEHGRPRDGHQAGTGARPPRLARSPARRDARGREP
jgi:preprotein translocase subunit SecA